MHCYADIGLQSVLGRRDSSSINDETLQRPMRVKCNECRSKVKAASVEMESTYLYSTSSGRPVGSGGGTNTVRSLKHNNRQRCNNPRIIRSNITEAENSVKNNS